MSNLDDPHSVSQSLQKTEDHSGDEEREFEKCDENLEYSRIGQEFQLLVDRSQQLFAGLRDLPPTGKNWQPYFQKTFEVFTKLWKFQQQNRVVLDNPTYYGLKRWEIGEIASKIGQLYYHYYLRTSETNYLNEAYVFYDAIRERQYFKDVMDVNNPALFIKKLRYYARFIVVCLLMNKSAVIETLMSELTALIEEYITVFQPADAAEWKLVISEISTFVEAEKKTFPVDDAQQIIMLPGRLQTEGDTRFQADGQPSTLKIQEAILVGNYSNQIKFSELTLDMYRMLQALEREPNAREASGHIKEEEGNANKKKRSNPHKYLLYRPTLGVLLNYLSIGYKDLHENTAMFLYLSADGIKLAHKNDHGYEGGIATMPTTSNTKRGPEDNNNNNQGIHCLYPQDLMPFTRKALFVVVDSSNSGAFRIMSSPFGKPLITLLSPVEYPSSIKDTSPLGSLFTLFLHSPIKAFLLLQSISQVVNMEAWQVIQDTFAAMEKDVLGLLEKGLSSYADDLVKFLQDDFTRTLIVRYILCLTVMKAHEIFNDPKYLPSSNLQPEVDGLSEHQDLNEKMQSILLKATQLSSSATTE